MEIWTIAKTLQWTTGYLAKKGSPTPRLDAEVLLADVLQTDRVYLYTHYEQPLVSAERDRYREYIQRRAAHEPVAYITSKREFYGREFKVSKEVLIPRPETEHVVENVLQGVSELQLTAPLKIWDIGTGSGVLAITLAAELRDLAATVLASDVSEAALAVAKDNAVSLGVSEQLTFVAGDLFAALAPPLPAPFNLEPLAFQVIVANLPYLGLEEQESLPLSVRHYEPSLALFAAEQGLALLKQLLLTAPAYLTTPGMLVAEMAPWQTQVLSALPEVQAKWAHLKVLPDLSGQPRLVMAIKV